MLKGGVRETDQRSLFPADQFIVERIHRKDRLIGFGRAGDDAPGLGNTVNLAFRVGDRTDGVTLVVISPAVPLPVPAVFIEGDVQFIADRRVTLGAGGIFLFDGEGYELLQDMVDKPS